MVIKFRPMAMIHFSIQLLKYLVFLDGRISDDPPKRYDCSYALLDRFLSQLRWRDSGRFFLNPLKIFRDFFLKIFGIPLPKQIHRGSAKGKSILRLLCRPLRHLISKIKPPLAP